jgi:hypothetical protein
MVIQNDAIKVKKPSGTVHPDPASRFAFSSVPECFIDKEGPIQALEGPE